MIERGPGMGFEKRQGLRSELGEVLWERKEGALWSKSTLLLCEYGIVRNMRAEAETLVDFRDEFSYTDLRTDHNRNFSYSYTDWYVEVFDVFGEGVYRFADVFKHGSEDDSHSEEISDWLRAATGEHVWPAALRRFEDGGTVSFGGLNISRAEVSFPNKHVVFAWGDIDRVALNQGRLLFETMSDGRPRRLQTLDLYYVRNLTIFLALAERLVPVEGRKKAWYQGWFGVNF